MDSLEKLTQARATAQRNHERCKRSRPPWRELGTAGSTVGHEDGEEGIGGRDRD